MIAMVFALAILEPYLFTHGRDRNALKKVVKLLQEQPKPGAVDDAEGMI